MKRTWLTFNQTLAECRGYFTSVSRHIKDRECAKEQTEGFMEAQVESGRFNRDFVDQIIQREAYT